MIPKKINNNNSRVRSRSFVTENDFMSHIKNLVEEKELAKKRKKSY